MRLSTNSQRNYFLKLKATLNRAVEDVHRESLTFDALQERIREIRLSEWVFYQKVKDTYTTSIGYNPKNEEAVELFKIVQNKLLWAISSQTAAELVARRADARLPMMGMTSCDKSDHGASPRPMAPPPRTT